MVSSVPNLTRISGVVRARASPGPVVGWDSVRLHVALAEPVAEQADLISAQVQHEREVEVAVRRELLGDAGPGWHLDLRARMTPNGLMAEKQPAEGHFAVTPPAVTPPAVTPPAVTPPGDAV